MPAAIRFRRRLPPPCAHGSSDRRWAGPPARSSFPEAPKGLKRNRAFRSDFSWRSDSWRVGPKHIFVSIAGLGRRGDVRDVVLRVPPHGELTLNSQPQKREELGRRLDAIYETRWSKHV